MVDVEPAVQFALAQQGKPYVFGAAGPNSYDCSGLTMRAFQKVGINMPHSTFEQIRFGTAVSRVNLQRGDLVFPDPGHVQIYLGNDMVVEAPHTGANVRVVKVWGFYAARRLGTASGTAPSTPATEVKIPNPMDIWREVQNLKDEFDSFLSVLSSMEKAASWLSKPHNWFRIALIIIGVGLLAIAARMLISTETTAVWKQLR
jgi:hypothetical protein